MEMSATDTRAEYTNSRSSTFASTVQIVSKTRTKQNAIRTLCISADIRGLVRPLLVSMLLSILHRPAPLQPISVATVVKNFRILLIGKRDQNISITCTNSANATKRRSSFALITSGNI
jgi:hypothetical protein